MPKGISISGKPSTDGKKLTARQYHAARLLAEGNHTNRAIAEEVGVTLRTFYKWKQRPYFLEAVEDALEEYLAEAQRILKRNGAKIAQQAVDLALGGSHRDTVQLEASTRLLKALGLLDQMQRRGDGSGSRIRVTEVETEQALDYPGLEQLLMEVLHGSAPDSSAEEPLIEE